MMNTLSSVFVFSFYPAIYIGVYIEDSKADDESLFITERHCFRDLFTGLSTACPCGLAVNAWTLVSMLQVMVNVKQLNRFQMIIM